jgi:putative hemolysin
MGVENQKMHSDIIEAIPLPLLIKEIDTLQEKVLVELKSLKAFRAKAEQIPHILQEIGRLREMTYREVGEGTGKPLDIDEFDANCEHIFIWDTENLKIVGAYRILNGKIAFQKSGKNGFYIHTLFEIDDALGNLLSQSLELGRSFIIKEYQKRPSPLFILWKALLFTILDSDARYLIGPVSISGDFSEEAKSISMKFLKANFCKNDIAQYIKPKNKYQPELPPNFNEEAFLKEVGQDFSKLDKYLSKYEDNYHTPILIRQYISLLNTNVIGFNVDPHFNNCLDALMLMDLSKAPKQTIENLVKDYPNPSAIYEKLKHYEYRA